MGRTWHDRRGFLTLLGAAGGGVALGALPDSGSASPAGSLARGVAWQRAYGGENRENDQFRGIAPGIGGGYAVAGQTLRFTRYAKGHALYMNGDGEIQWELTYESDHLDASLTDVVQSGDQYVFLGRKTDSTGQPVPFVVAVGPDGDENWIFEPEQNTTFVDATGTGDGGAAMVARDGSLLILDANGDPAEFKRGFYPGATAITTDDEDGYFVCTSNGELIGVRANGEEGWTRKFRGIGTSGFNDVTTNTAGSPVVVGQSKTDPTEDSVVFMVSTTPNGQDRWTRRSGADGPIEGYSIDWNGDGFVVGANLEGDVPDARILFTDSSGSLQESVELTGRDTYNRVEDVHYLPSGNMIGVGSTGYPDDVETFVAWAFELADGASTTDPATDAQTTDADDGDGDGDAGDGDDAGGDGTSESTATGTTSAATAADDEDDEETETDGGGGGGSPGFGAGGALAGLLGGGYLAWRRRGRDDDA